MANTPIGASRTTKPVIRPSASAIRDRERTRGPVFSIPIRAIPSAMLKTTTAGTVLLASDSNGFAGMKSCRKSNAGGCSTIVLLKNEADVQSGMTSEKSRTLVSAMPQSSKRKPPARRASSTASLAVRLPSPVTRETTTYGRTVIWSSRMNTWPAIPTGAISSPRNAPTTIPAARPNRTCVARLILALLRYFPGGSMGEVLAQGDAGHQGQFTRTRGRAGS